MISIYKTNEQNCLLPCDIIEPNCWIDLVDPTMEEIELVIKETKTEKDLLVKVLDDEELPRIEKDGDSTLIVVDFPFVEDKKRKNKYTTIPLGMISNSEYFITISLKSFEALQDFKNEKIKSFFTYKKTRFTIQILMQISVHYLRCLKIINEEIDAKEKVLYKSTENKELTGLLNIQKSLVYFITSLNANDVILEKLSKNTIIPMYEEDKELLENAMIENKQGIETAKIYREILSSVSDTYATIISNNLNVVMKFLAGITIVFSIPTMIASFLGMNVPLGALETSPVAFILILLVSLIVAVIIAILLKFKDML